MEIVKLNPAPKPGKGAFCETATARLILDAIHRAHSRRQLALITGPSGIGKTWALRQYQREHSEAILITFSPATEALVPALQSIAEAIGGIAPTTGARAVRTAIVDRISYNLGRDTILLLDECHMLDDKPIVEITSLHDELGVAIVFCGEPSFSDRLNRSPSSSNHTWKPLLSRLGVKVDLAGPTPEDIAALCDHYQIAGQRSRGFLLEMVVKKNKKSVREVARLIETAYERAGESGRIEEKHLRDAAVIEGMPL